MADSHAIVCQVRCDVDGWTSSRNEGRMKRPRAGGLRPPSFWGRTATSSRKICRTAPTDADNPSKSMGFARRSSEIGPSKGPTGVSDRFTVTFRQKRNGNTSRHAVKPMCARVGGVPFWRRSDSMLATRDDARFDRPRTRCLPWGHLESESRSPVPVTSVFGDGFRRNTIHFGAWAFTSSRYASWDGSLPEKAGRGGRVERRLVFAGIGCAAKTI